jgi:hypothetical protein
MTDSEIKDLKPILDSLNTTALGKRWEYYDRSVAYAEKMEQYNTGREIEKQMVQFNPRESNEMFEQACRLTKQIIPSICASIRNTYQKVPDSNEIKKIKAYKSDKEGEKSEKMVKLDAVLSKFYGQKSVDFYLNKRLIDLNAIDPNTYIVIEWKSFDNNKVLAQPYPFEARSRMVVNKEVFNGNTLWIIVQNGLSFTYYGENRSVKYTQVIDEKFFEQFKETVLFVPFEFAGFTYIKLNDRIFYQIFAPEPHNLKFVPAFFVGFKDDLCEFGELSNSILHDGMPYLDKLVKVTRELDLSTTLHLFPKLFQYVRKCTATGCNNGEHADGGKCTRCNGRGFEVHTTAQDIIVLPMPSHKDEMLPLADLIHYAYTPIDIIKILMDYEKEIGQRAALACFNQDILVEKTQIAATKYQVGIENSKLSDTLHPFALQYGDAWVFFTGTIAKIVSLDADLEISCFIPKDFKLDSLEEKQYQLTQAIANGLPQSVVDILEDDVMYIMLKDDQLKKQMYDVKKKFEPFRAMTEATRVYILGTLPADDYEKVLYTYFGKIFEELEFEHGKTGVSFYYLPYEKQRAAVDAKVAEYAAGLKVEPVAMPDFSVKDEPVIPDADKTNPDDKTKDDSAAE